MPARTGETNAPRTVVPLFEWLAPDLALPSVLALEPAMLVRLGVKGLILDLDNTLVAYGVAAPDPAVVRHIQALRAAGHPAVLLSNARSGRAAAIAAVFEVECVLGAHKPGTRGFQRAMQLLGTSPPQTAVVGDQIFRDVLGARRSGCLAVFVQPLSPDDFPGTKLLRIPEAALIRHFRRTGRWPAPETVPPTDTR